MLTQLREEMMKTYLKTTLAMGALGAGVLAWYWASNEPPPVTPTAATEVDAGATQAKRRAAKPAEHPDAAAVESIATVDYPYERAAPPIEGEVVSTFGDQVPFNTVASDCDYEPDAVDQWRCRLDFIADHPYQSMDERQLAQIADHDGAAALILAHRLGAIDFVAAKPHARRAFVLTGDRYAWRMLGDFDNVFVGERVYEGQLDVGLARRAYVHQRAGFEVGSVSFAEVALAADILRRHGYGDELPMLDAEATGFANELRRERLQLVGEDF